jgi:hypothetical protein
MAGFLLQLTWRSARALALHFNTDFSFNATVLLFAFSIGVRCCRAAFTEARG